MPSTPSSLTQPAIEELNQATPPRPTQDKHERGCATVEESTNGHVRAGSPVNEGGHERDILRRLAVDGTAHHTIRSDRVDGYVNVAS
ncbi:hypothetical protein PISMIDRAFT_681697 [Pisolithus microcarpus 441]|uniref:Uncharacterized protein n=1 Tax=Pisolithus microcarpus 441 TaxID=765257 RepID=A0A0C9ZMW0_9AGAM|nr:hypothetical protein PISMIDRAFT_681697 [Pisolithus microcarpus 441]